ncbi:unnamed protein product, partial [Mesorhabditis spiculigera]
MLGNAKSLIRLAMDPGFETKFSGPVEVQQELKWRAGWAVLKANMFFVFERTGTEKNDAVPPFLLLIIEDCFVELGDDNMLGKEFTFKINYKTTGKSYTLCSDSFKSLGKWVSLLTITPTEYISITTQSFQQSGMDEAEHKPLGDGLAAFKPSPNKVYATLDPVYPMPDDVGDLKNVAYSYDENGERRQDSLDEASNDIPEPECSNGSNPARRALNLDEIRSDSVTDFSDLLIPSGGVRYQYQTVNQHRNSYYRQDSDPGLENISEIYVADNFFQETVMPANHSGWYRQKTIGNSVIMRTPCKDSGNTNQLLLPQDNPKEYEAMSGATYEEFFAVNQATEGGLPDDDTVILDESKSGIELLSLAAESLPIDEPRDQFGGTLLLNTLGRNSVRKNEALDADSYGSEDECQIPCKKKKKKKPDQKDRDSSKSLKLFASKVRDKVQRKGVTTYAEVAEELVQEYFDSVPMESIEKRASDGKNIRRRVYDALNVLIALRLIKRDKKTIVWANVDSTRVDYPSEEIHALREIVQHRQKIIGEMLSEIVSTKSLCERNATYEQVHGVPHSDDVITMPFALLLANPKYGYRCRVDTNQQDAVCQFGAAAKVVTDNEVMERLGHTYGINGEGIDDADLPKIKSYLPPFIHDILPKFLRFKTEPNERFVVPQHPAPKPARANAGRRQKHKPVVEQDSASAVKNLKPNFQKVIKIDPDAPGPSARLC